ncbi:hypothetical protein MKX01_002069 [Papaver californicum]|nr:hypothetical protein MKX01_002069 [Papaver californicum]
MFSFAFLVAIESLFYMDTKQPGFRVIVRERPFLDSEKDSNSNPRSCISSEFLSTNEVSVLLKDLQTSRKECYKVDSFYVKQDDNVSQIFSEEISPLLQWIFQGSNATFFAYGATGSGKTYTMQVLLRFLKGLLDQQMY